MRGVNPLNVSQENNMPDNAMIVKSRPCRRFPRCFRLEPDAVRRVLKWANERFQVKPSAPSMSDYSPQGSENTSQAFSEFSDLFDAANPTMDVADRLVAAYWFQVVLKHDDLDSQQLNTELKHLGHPSANITRALDNLMNRSPPIDYADPQAGHDQAGPKTLQVDQGGYLCRRKNDREPKWRARQRKRQ